MTNEQILKKAIEKVKKNGWEKEVLITSEHLRFDIDEWLSTRYYSIIFSHSFAKAFAWYIYEEKPEEARNFMDKNTDMFGETKETRIEMIKDIFLIEMVLEEEPLKYLEKFL